MLNLTPLCTIRNFVPPYLKNLPIYLLGINIRLA